MRGFGGLNAPVQAKLERGTLKSVLEVLGWASPSSTGYALGVKQPLDARIHLFPFDEFLPVGLRDAFAHGGAKTSVLLKQTQGGILHQPLGIRTGMTSGLG
jgi:hypothetical protein